MPRELIDYFVLDSLADDVESLEQILPAVRRSLEHWEVPEPATAFTREHVVGALVRLVRDRSIAALTYDAKEKALVDIGEGIVPSGLLDDYWFRMTGRGRVLHQSWQPPAPRRAD